MDIHVHHHLHFEDADPERVFRRFAEELDNLSRKVEHMSTQLDALKQAVEATTQVEQSAIELIRGLAEQIKQAGTDANKLDELRASLLSKAAELGNAVAANTPAAPPAPEAPPAPPADGGAGEAPSDPTGGQG